MMIEYEDLARSNAIFRADFERSFRQLLDGGQYILGNAVADFEAAFATYNQSGYCVGVASGMDALTLALRCANLPPRSEVIVPAHTFVASVLAVYHAGHVPVLVEPDLRTYNLDGGRVEESLTPRTAAIMPTHLYGKCCDMDALATLASKHHLLLIEDCAQAHGATYRGVKAGNFGSFGAFSFYPTKNLGALGDAGGVVVNDQRAAEALRKWRNYGSDTKYNYELPGYNSRLDALQAGFLRIKLVHLDRIIAHKRLLANCYLRGLKEDFVKPVVHPDYGDAYHIFAVRHPARDALRKYLLAKGIKTEVHYPLAPHQQPALRGVLPTGSFPVTEMIGQTVVSLPLSYGHSVAEVERVVEVMNAF